MLPAEFAGIFPVFFRLLLREGNQILFFIDLKNNRHVFSSGTEITANLNHLERLVGSEFMALFYFRLGRALLRKRPDFSVAGGVRIGHQVRYAVCAATVIEQVAIEGDGELGVAGVISLPEREMACSGASSDQGFDCAMLKSQQRLMANMSHEIRTPMAGVLGLVDLALDTGPDTEQKQYLYSIRECTNSLLSVLNDIIDFSKISEGKYLLENHSFDFVELLDDVLRLFAMGACRKNIELICHVAPGVPNSLIGDPGRIRQVLVNLVSNAIKFTDIGEVHISASVSKILRHHAILEVSVRDTGIGIGEGNLARIFNPFEQVDFSNTRRFGGAGLGLSICKSLVEAMHGVIGVVSELGRGSEFKVKIPLAIKLDALSRTSQPNKMGRILICSPHVSVSGVIRKYLSNAESVVECQDPLGDRFKVGDFVGAQRRFDLVFWDTDIDAQGGGGLDVSWLVKAPRLIVVSSALRFASDSARCKELGLGSILSKPFTNRSLFRAVASACEAREEPVPELLEDVSASLSGSDGYTVQELFANGHQPRVLVVDDDYYGRTNIVATLERAGYKVDAESNGEAAVERFRPGEFDVVVMDVQMPFMDGLAATKAMRLKEMRNSWVMSASASLVPIIGLTADTQVSLREEAIQAGMNRVLTKPVTRRELILALTEEMSEAVNERLIG